MREAARALDDVSDHLGEVLRRADDLLVEWSRFGAQVRDQVEREAAAIGEVVDGAVARAAAGGIDRAIGDRLRGLTAELERLEQRARAASHAAVAQREADRRILWAVVAGLVLANALLVVLILRRPDAAPVAEPIRLDPVAAPPTSGAAPAAGATPDPAPGATAGSSAAAAADAAAGALIGYGAGSPPGGAQGATTGPSAGSTGGPSAGSTGGPSAGASGGPSGGASGGPTAGASAARQATAGSGAPAPPGGAPRPADAGSRTPPIAPARPGAAHPHKKWP